MVAGHRSDRAAWGVLTVIEPRDEDQVREGNGVPDPVQVCVRED